VTVGTLAATIVFAEIASERGWPLYVTLSFLAAVWAAFGLAYRNSIAQPRRTLGIFLTGMVALVGGLAVFSSILTGALAIAAAFIVVVALVALMRFALRQS